MSILGTKEWMPHNENCMKGCKNNCRYCYAKKRAIRYKRATAENWHIMEPNKRSLKPIRYLKGGVMFPTTHDLHIEHADIWMPFLRGLLEKGNDVLIVTKPQFAAIHAICRQFYKYADQIEFRFTIGTLNEETRAFWEPGAPTIHERIQALQFAFETGYPTSVSMEPLLTSTPGMVVNEVYPFVTGTIWIGLMNYLKASDFSESELGWYSKQCAINCKPNMQRVYESLKDNPKIRWKDSVQDLLGITQNGEIKGV